ncbi:UvrD-helicase domain-containing protein [Flavobacteriales bacterium]|nr:UvrD-helicase domain-containing protein [Flavobacteriales bacterium]
MENIPFKIYSASAGSGKTFTLVKEYLKICLTSKSPKKFVEILAVTFTNKAAAEMKDRIISSLKSFSNPKTAEQTDLEMRALIVSETGLTIHELTVRAQAVFENILHNYSQFSIGTIDKFTHRIIRTFAQDLDLPQNFEVELEHKLLLKQAVDLLISKTGEDEKLTQLLVNFIKDKTADDKSWLIENDFYLVAEELLKESGQEHCDNLKELNLDDFFIIQKSIQKYINKFDQELSAIGIGFVDDCKDQGISPEWLVGGKNGLHKYFDYLRTQQWEKYIPTKTNYTNIEKENWYASKAPTSSYASIDSLQEKHKPFVNRALEILLDYPKYVKFRLIASNFYAMAVLHEISKQMQYIKEQNNIIPIGEFNKKIATVLQNEEGNFIYERLGERYANYFIDEFQDTSELQWENLLPLLENAIANGQKPGSAMLVGDAKQAIYRWRGGEVDQFIELQLKAASPSGKEPYKMEACSLDFNYRSAAEIVDFNNQFFSSVAPKIENQKYSALFSNLNSKQVRGTGGHVSIEYIDYNGDYEELQKARCLSNIEQLREDGFNYGDICILTRTKAKGTVLVKLLSEKGIPVVSAESLLLEQSTEVKFMLNFLRFLNEPMHPRYRFKLIEYLNENEFCTATLENVHIQLDQLCNASLSEFNAFLKSIISDYDMLKWRSISLVELSHKIARSFKLEETARIYMQFFMDEVWAYSTKYAQDLFGFLNYWEETAHKLSVAIPEGINAVQVMTIHKSKGLEFPAVIFPFANWNATSEQNAKSWVETDAPELHNLPTSLIPISDKLKSSTEKLQSLYVEHKSKVLLDNLNMLYVALTRPKTRLYIQTSSKGGNLSTYFDHFLKEQGLWEPDKAVYTFGSPVAYHSKPRPKNTNLEVSTPIKDLSKVLKISRQAPRMWEVDHPEKGADKGRKIHEILSYIKVESDLNSALEKALREGLLSNNELKEVHYLLQQTLHHPKLKKYFSVGLKVKNEEDILLENGKVIRPDRLVFMPDGITIIDYKTGTPLAAHEEQILTYRSHIVSMGYPVISCVLVYINEECVELNEVVL